MLKEYILHRHPANPILKPEDMPFPADAVFNCGQTMFKGKTLLLLAVTYRGKPFLKDNRRPEANCIAHSSGMHVATSEDGVHFKVEPKPFISMLKDKQWFGFDDWVIDPRVTKIGDTYYIIRPGDGYCGTIAFLEKTKDWKKREFVDCVALPCNRVPSLFPEKINGRYARLDRPSGMADKGSIWLSFSPDLVHWGSHRPVLLPGYMPFFQLKIGPTPPIRTKKGWLVIIHGVWQSCADCRYSLGAMVLDLKDPSKIIGKTVSWILTPDRDYELRGHVGNVVFACGALVDERKDEIRVYYGAADECIGLATGRLSELLDACIRGI